MTCKDKLFQEFEESISVKRQLFDVCHETLDHMAQEIFQCFKKGGKLLVCGNGGSAADAQHLAAELVGRYLTEREALPCVALTTDTSIITAVGNDYGFDNIFSRQVLALARPGDCLMVISTSGNSPNIIAAIDAARNRGCTVFALGGKDGGRMATLADKSIVVPSSSTPRIQESHILMIHSLCLLIDDFARSL